MRSYLSVVLCLALSSAAVAEVKFKKHVLSTVFVSEGCAVADFNKDGRIDVLAGPYWFEAPAGNRKWHPHEIREPGTFNYAGGYSRSFICGAADVNLDGWPDAMIIGFPATEARWYENNRNAEGHWKENEITPFACGETPMFTDVNGDGQTDLVAGFKPHSQPRGWMAVWMGPTDPKNVRWELYPISGPKSPGTEQFYHGLGVGDMNNDDRNDVIIREGWWEAPEDRNHLPWAFHAASLGEDCADLIPFDVDADGDTDVISSSAHKYGIWWHEQIRENGQVGWRTHTIYDKISQTHAIRLADINGDDLPDLVTGKRFFAHNGHDPGADEPAVVMWFEFSRRDGRPAWTPHVIDDDSGIGTQFVVQDINTDGKLDIVTSNKKGTFFFENTSD